MDKFCVLYLTNNDNALVLYEWLKDKCDVVLCEERLDLEYVQSINPSLIVSYNYKYLIKEDVIEYMKGRIINLHISYLPWNRGSSPNFWSFYDDTPKGVTIHQISAGLDEGMILYQKNCEFNISEETFVTSYDTLNKTIVELFKENWEEIKNSTYELHPQKGQGSYHTMREFNELVEQHPFKWTDNIGEYLAKCKAIERKW